MVSAQSAHPDVSDMVVVHDVLRDVLDAAPALVGAAGPADQQRVALISNFYDNILSFLAAHHGGEDALVFPRLIERCPADAVLVEHIASQHHDVHAAVAASEQALKEWAAGDVSAQSRVASALQELGETMRTHLADEERELLPLCEANLSIQEWGELPGHAMRAFAGDNLWLITGLIRERMTQDQRDMMLANMPPPLVEMWVSSGEDAFNTLIAEVGPPLG
jgi:hemerythrin-like domain-containing protein